MPGVEHLDDVLRVDAPGGPRLALEALDGLLVAGELRLRITLTATRRPVPDVHRLVDRAHPAVPDLAEDPVSPVQDRTDQHRPPG